MTIDKTSSKSIRMTAVDGDQIRVFLLMVGAIFSFIRQLVIKRLLPLYILG